MSRIGRQVTALEIAERLRGETRVVAVTHEAPDGDALGCSGGASPNVRAPGGDLHARTCQVPVTFLMSTSFFLTSTTSPGVLRPHLNLTRRSTFWTVHRCFAVIPTVSTHV